MDKILGIRPEYYVNSWRNMLDFAKDRAGVLHEVG